MHYLHSLPHTCTICILPSQAERAFLNIRGFLRPTGTEENNTQGVSDIQIGRENKSISDFSRRQTRIIQVDIFDTGPDRFFVLAGPYRLG